MCTDKEVFDLAILAGEILLHNGAEVFRVQETMIKIAEAYYIKSFNVYIVSNGLFASINEQGQVHSTAVRHIPLSPVHLGRVAAVNQISREISEGKYEVKDAFERLKEVEKMPYTSKKFQVLCSGIGSGCFCYLFGGNIYDSLTSFLSGLILYVFILYVSHKKLSKIIINILGSGLVTVCGLFFFYIGMGNNLDKIIIGSIIPLVPGVPLTNAVRDFFNSDYLSGTIRFIDALLIAFCIAIGVGAVLKFWNSLGVGGQL